MLLTNRLRLTTSTLLVTGLSGVLLSPLGALTPTATASSVYLCNGYTSCGQAGYSDGGYGRVNNKMYWRMYSGHNCTNYVAHRMIQAGMSTERPWAGSGMAYNWGFAMKDKTDNKPTVGSVAWWNRGVSGAGSSGHVAIVEKVISPTEILISEDSWSGDFHWRRIVKDGTSWPTGFIHFVDKSMTNTNPPRVEGEPQVDVPLRAKRGAWSASGTFSYQWLADGAAIPGADRIGFTPTAAQAGRAISVVVSGSKPGFTPSSATSKPTAVVAPGVLASSGAPVVDGQAMVGEVLTATSSGWAPTPGRTQFTWYADGEAIANGAKLRLGRALVGKKVGVVHVARSDGYEKAVSEPSQILGPVAAGAIEVTEPFGASGLNRVGEELTVIPGAITPTDATMRLEWMRDGELIPGADQATYTLTADDLGARVMARVTLSKPRYRPAVRTFHFGDPVTTRPTVRVNAVGRSKGASIGIRVAAPGVPVTDGQLTVVVGNRTVTVPLKNGAARVVVPRLVPGVRRVVVTYAGSGLVERVVTRDEVRVQR